MSQLELPLSLYGVLMIDYPQVVKALATAQIERKKLADEAHEDSKATGAQDFDLQIENMSKERLSACTMQDLPHPPKTLIAES